MPKFKRFDDEDLGDALVTLSSGIAESFLGEQFAKGGQAGETPSGWRFETPRAERARTRGCPGSVPKAIGHWSARNIDAVPAGEP
jgi:hypothetical protein